MGSILELFEHALPGTVLDPSLEVAVAGDIGEAEVMGQVSPAAAGGEHVEHAVHCFPKVGRRTTKAVTAPSQERCNERELPKGDVRRVRFTF
ncbi:MAG: hypothetical protein UW92_C0015G0006 [Candidatus Jorgensenbacteria bacterium GW2011_GWA2_45_13]|uniref:Uncharacterized protein n=1 Tax=Candidatus Jorgensenbacteria bacterium GW2011_GWA2_45_13 TaxID=1618662 RepID=A0A0G1L5M8_9BACT|nr:MAG: hypothetical protein UW92_C0015G0006 [Candidatus Jorgensenbacteria bacterium GW2011_GWA2_45_13]